ncbi:type I-E CRISPR-associated protein Cse1/CasA [bacterium]|nr:type I-E CRISPR-associated protein Cse1/CasA [bacterium]
MSDTTKEQWQEAEWNVLTSGWLEVMTLYSEAQVYSPLEALNRASTIRCIALASPLDLFAAHRFLLTLLYWKADVAGGVQQVRESLLRGEFPRVMLDAIEAGAPCFRMFDDKAPFLQDPSVRPTKEEPRKSAGSLFAEFASGTNIAHFHHGHDKNMRLCLRCAMMGMLRLVPWSQSGGAGLTPSVHNAPPIMAIATGDNLAMTLGLNLVPLDVEAGDAKWSGHFKPTDSTKPIPHLEALTWNPRRIYLPSPEKGICWYCGQTEVLTIGPIVYKKNEEAKLKKEKSKTIPFIWQDPSAFYAANKPHTTTKSTNEKLATSGRDLTRLLDEKNVPTSAVVAANPDQQGWHLVIPCTTGKDNKTFDHRQLELTSLWPDAVRAKLPAGVPLSRPKGIDGWAEPRRVAPAGGATLFVQAAARLLTHTDWAALSAAAYREMHDSPAAFDVLSGLLWPLRRTVAGLPSRNVAWLVLKLMAGVPPRARVPHANSAFCPLRSLPKRQLDERRKDRSVASLYPVSFPRGHRLEADLRSALDSNMRQRTPESVDWPSLCHGLDQLLD